MSFDPARRLAGPSPAAATLRGGEERCFERSDQSAVSTFGVGNDSTSGFRVALLL